MLKHGLVAALLVLTGPKTVHAGETSPLQARHAWIRLMPPSLPSAAYVELRNDTDRPVVLDGATSPRYGNVALHRSRVNKGMSMMQATARVTIPAHGRLRLAPGGFHLMLMQPRGAIAVGDTVPLALHFADGHQQTVDFIARPANALGDTPVAPSTGH